MSRSTAALLTEPLLPVPAAAEGRAEQWVMRGVRRRSFRLGLIAFVAISVAGMATSIRLAHGAGLWTALRGMSIPAAGLLAVLVGVDWLLGGFRLWIFARAVTPGVTLRDAVRANLANMFLGAVTPSQSGGGAAHIYVLWRAGVPIACGIALSAINFVATLVTLFLAALFIVWRMPADLPAVMRETLQYSFVAVSLILGVFVVALIWPRAVGVQVIHGLDALRRRAPRRVRRVLTPLRRGLARGLAEYVRGLRVYGRRPDLIALSVVSTFALYFNKCLIGYVVALGLGMHAAFWGVIAAQLLVLFVAYFAPTPGASFVAEVSNTFLMGHLAHSRALAAFTLLCRMSTVWLAVALGGFVLALQLKRDTQRAR